MSVIFRWCFFKCPTVDKCHPYHNQTFQTANQLFIYLFIYLKSLLLSFNFLQFFCCLSIHQGTCWKITTKTHYGRIHCFLYYFDPSYSFVACFHVRRQLTRTQLAGGGGSPPLPYLIPNFSMRAFFQCVVIEMLIEVPLFQK